MKHYVAEGTGTFETTRADIEGLRYLGDPRKASRYLGIPQVQVEDVWAEMPEPRKRHSGRISYTRDDCVSPRDYQVDIRPDNEAACERLKCATLNAMLRWADCNGTTPEQTVEFLLYGRMAA